MFMDCSDVGYIKMWLPSSADKKEDTLEVMEDHQYDLSGETSTRNNQIEEYPHELSGETSIRNNRIGDSHGAFFAKVDLPGLSQRRALPSHRKLVKADEQTLLERIGLEAEDDKSVFELERMESSLQKFFRSTHYEKNEKPNELNSDEQKDVRQKIKEMMEQEFPVKDQIPTGRQLINVGEVEANRSMYAPGDWVEIEGLDMKWRLDMITRVIKTAPDNWDWNDPANEGKEPKWIFTYNAGAERNVEAYDLRTPETGLKLIFGCRPWVWQQWALLKLEAKIRFQKGHQDDFMEMDIQRFAADLWDQWLEHPANAEFSEVFYDERIGEKGRALLANHVSLSCTFNKIVFQSSHHFCFRFFSFTDSKAVQSNRYHGRGEWRMGFFRR